jgi:abortive infection bacteriophage resistance protein
VSHDASFAFKASPLHHICSPMLYNKSAKTIQQQLEILKKRGLEIDNAELACEYLKTVGYYRLSGYWWPMISNKETRTFKSRSNFSNIINIYNFDKELRMLLFRVIESIEIAFRTKLIYYTSNEVSPWWYEDPEIFKEQSSHQKLLFSIDRELKQTKENFIKQHYKKYFSDSRRPPAWKTLEIASFGTISKLYSNLLDTIKVKKMIAKEFGAVNQYYLPSWLQSIAQIRNIIAHHGRLWNKNLPGRPKLLKKPPNPWISNVPHVSEHHRIYIHLSIMKYMLNIIHTHNDFTEKLNAILDKYRNIDPKAMGMNYVEHVFHY